MAMLPHFNIDATIISFSESNWRGFDTALIKIDKISDEVPDVPNSGEPFSIENFDMPFTEMPDNPNEIPDIPPVTGEGPDIPYIIVRKGIDLPPENQAPFVTENVDYIPKVGDTIVVLFLESGGPNLVEGSKFKTVLWSASTFNIYTYEIID